MGLSNGCYATIWSARPYGKIFYCQVSVSSKDQSTGNYVQRFADSHVSFAGKAAEKVAALGLAEKYEQGSGNYKKIKVLNIDVQTYLNQKRMNELLPLANGNQTLEYFIRDKCNDKSVTVFDFELADAPGSGGQKTQRTAAKSKPAPAQTATTEEFVDVDGDDTEGLPFN